MDTKQTHESNRASWNEAAARYEQEIDSDVAFIRSGGKNLEQPELRILHDLKDWCHRAIHLQCAGGRDTLSLWNQGAVEVVGVDISDRMIECARRKSELLSAPAQWFRCDVLETPHSLDGTADLVYTGRGALCWIMDIDAWAGVVKRLLKPGGCVYVFEGHPFDWLWDPESQELRLDPNPPFGNYFSTQIGAGEGWPSQYIPASVLPEKPNTNFERQWNLGMIVTALARTGLRLELLEEHPDQYWDVFPKLPKDVMDRMPHTFSLLMRK